MEVREIILRVLGQWDYVKNLQRLIEFKSTEQVQLRREKNDYEKLYNQYKENSQKLYEENQRLTKVLDDKEKVLAGIEAWKKKHECLLNDVAPKMQGLILSKNEAIEKLNQQKRKVRELTNEIERLQSQLKSYRKRQEKQKSRNREA